MQPRAFSRFALAAEENYRNLVPAKVAIEALFRMRLPTRIFIGNADRLIADGATAFLLLASRLPA